MSLLQKRSAGLLVFVVQGGNPNGDPDADARPRLTVDNRGLVTDGSIKRKLRSLFEDVTRPTYRDLQERLKFDSDKFHMWESVSRGFDTDDPGKALAMAKDFIGTDDPKKLLARYADMRWFGTTAIEEKEAETTDEENGESEKKPARKAKRASEEGTRISLKRTGVITIRPAFSVGLVRVVEASLTKIAPMRHDNMEKRVGDIAPAGKKFIQLGVYFAPISVNPHFANATGTTEQDIEVFKGALPYVFAMSQSSSRPAGSVAIRHLWWRDHDKPLGSFNELDWWNLLTPRKVKNVDDYSTSLDDFEFPRPKDGEGVDLIK